MPTRCLKFVLREKVLFLCAATQVSHRLSLKSNVIRQDHLLYTRLSSSPTSVFDLEGRTQPSDFNNFGFTLAIQIENTVWEL